MRAYRTLHITAALRHDHGRLLATSRLRTALCPIPRASLRPVAAWREETCLVLREVVQWGAQLMTLRVVRPELLLELLAVVVEESDVHVEGEALPAHEVLPVRPTAVPAAQPRQQSSAVGAHTDDQGRNTIGAAGQIQLSGLCRDDDGFAWEGDPAKDRHWADRRTARRLHYGASAAHSSPAPWWLSTAASFESSGRSRRLRSRFSG